MGSVLSELGLMLRSLSLWQKCVLFALLLVYLFTAWFAEGWLSYDEHFQILEFWHYRVIGLGEENLPWEFGSRMRPALPVVIVSLVSAASPFDSDPWILARTLRLGAAALSLYVGAVIVRYLVATGTDKLHFPLAAYPLLLTGLWFMPVIGSRYMSDNIGGLLFWLAVFVFLNACHKEEQGRFSLSQALTIGCLLGLAFVFRYHMLFAIAGLGLWWLLFCRLNWKTIAVMACGFFLIQGVEVVADRWLYGEFTFPPWNYLYQNIVLGKASGFRKEPFYFYFVALLEKSPAPIGLLIIASFGWYVYRNPKHAISWSIVPFILAHLLVDLKDLRFLYPLLPVVPLVMGLFLSHFIERWRRLRIFRWVAGAIIAMNSALLLAQPFFAADPRAVFFYHMNQLQASFPDAPVVSNHFNPYEVWGTLQFRFYNPRNIRVRDQSTLPPASDYVYIHDFSSRGRFAALEDDDECELTFSTYPQWAKKVDVGGWIGRAHFWEIYYCRK